MKFDVFGGWRRCAGAVTLAKLPFQLRAAEDRLANLEAEVKHYRHRAVQILNCDDTLPSVPAINNYQQEWRLSHYQQTDEPLHPALYLRVSTADQTTESQRRELQAAADRMGHTVVEIYADNGISGSKGRAKRPGFDRLLKDGPTQVRHHPGVVRRPAGAINARFGGVSE